MTKCANCPAEAQFTYAVAENYLIHYCQRHLPRFLTWKKNAGQLPLQVPAAPVVEEVVAPKPSKKKEVVVEETPVEEPEVPAAEETDGAS
jgi:hypothetical protein